MSEELRKKRRICAGHRSSATRMIQEVEERLAVVEADPSARIDLSKLKQLRISLEDKLDTLR